MDQILRSYYLEMVLKFFLNSEFHSALVHWPFRSRALTREVGALREELRRETKRREEALARAKFAEEEQDQMQRHCNELRYSNQKLTQVRRRPKHIITLRWIQRPKHVFTLCSIQRPHQNVWPDVLDCRYNEH